MKKTILYVFLALVAFLYGQTQLDWNSQLRNRPNITRVGTNSTWTDVVTLSGDAFAKSGRPWFDVMAYGAKNDGATDDTAAIQSVITAACAAGGGTVYFPPSTTANKYYRVALSGTTSPFIASCDNLTFTSWNGTSFSGSSNMMAQIFAPNLNAAIFTTSGGQRFGLVFYGLQLTGPGAAQTGSQGINIVNSGSTIIQNVYFGQFGSSCVVTQAGTGLYLTNNVGINCLLVRPATTDTGAADISSSDTVANGNFFSVSVLSAAGNLGTGHAYAWAVRGTNGYYSGNMGELSQHGWLVSGNFNRLVSNRAFLNQGNGYNITGIGNILHGNISLTNGQNADNTLDGFIISGSSGTYNNNVCNATGGNGNQQRHCFSDSNSTGLAETNENQYSDNRADTTGIKGVLYNMTGTAPYRIDHPHRMSSDRGDNNVTIQCGVDADTQFFNTPLTINRTVTFSTTGAWVGCKFRLIRTVSSSGGSALATTAATGGNIAPGQAEDYEWSGTQWQAVNMGIVALPGTNSSAQLFNTDGRFVFGNVPVTNCNTSQKTEIAADANLLTCAIPAAIGSYRVRFVLSVSAANAATLGWTMTWTDSNGASVAPTNQPLFQQGVAAPALTYTISAGSEFWGSTDIDVNNGGTSIVVKLTFSGTSFTGKASATVERIL